MLIEFCYLEAVGTTRARGATFWLRGIGTGGIGAVVVVIGNTACHTNIVRATNRG